ncbi:MAG: hypothetical protein RIQ49_2214, partial [Pseudomonadota bacterium]
VETILALVVRERNLSNAMAVWPSEAVLGD